MIHLSSESEAAIRIHAEQGFPLEVCGFLVGTDAGEGRSISAAWPVRNAWEDDPELRRSLFESLERVDEGTTAAGWEVHSEERRFLVDPRDTIDSMKRARSLGLDLVGLYHTHPNHPAVPSVFDLSIAWPEWSYIIISVRDGLVSEIRSWRVPEGQSTFVEEQVDLSV